MNRLFFVLLACAVSSGLFRPFELRAQTFPGVVIWSEPELHVPDSAVPSSSQLAQAFPQARVLSADQLPAELQKPETRLLLLSQSSAVPEAAWSAIYSFLERGGNLLVLGGRPFSLAAYHDDSGWHLRDYSMRFSRLLGIDQYQSTPGSVGAEFTPNPDIPLELSRFSWKQAFSPVIRLSSYDIYHRGGSAGTLDARLDSLVWGVADGRRLSAPIIQIDHLSGGFDSGRWIFVSAELESAFYSSSDSSILLRTLAQRALRGAEEFTVRPTLPLYLHGEPIELETIFRSTEKHAAPLNVQVSIYPEDQPGNKQTATIVIPAVMPTVVAPPQSKGLHIIEARLLEGSSLRAVYRSAFWIRDDVYLRSGPRLAVNSNYFTIDDKPLAVVGTTYMSSEVQRLYFDHPNVYVWNRDLRQIRDAGLNMIRTGWWTGWDKTCDETGRPYERTLRTLEAYLMTARKFGLPVQFNFFAFLPEVLGGTNAYLDPQAVRKQQNLMQSVAARFHEVPFLAWDLINEPSFSQHLWKMRPNGDPIERAAWNAWLSQKYPDRAALAAVWNIAPDSVAGTIALPAQEEFDPRGVYIGANSLRVYDYVQFAQEKFAEWVRGMREALRAVGSTQPITVGQDEGGYLDRLSPAFFTPYIDFTTNHSWWQNDHLLWDSLVAKQPGKAMLIQETGLQRELTPDEMARRTPEQEAALFERKFALSFVQGSGAIEWLWNSNSYMTESNETPIGAIRPDGTEKPEATVLRSMAKFAAAASPYLRNPKRPEIAVITSQAAQFSVQGDLQIAAQQNAVRALAYNLHQPCYIITENQIDKLGSPKLAILPSAQALRESTWQTLLAYVRNGGNLLVTGPLSRDEHWHAVDRLTPLGIEATTLPLTFREWEMVSIARRDRLSISVPFDQQKQQLLEFLKFEDPSSMKTRSLGKGMLQWEAVPVELSSNPQAPAFLYGGIVPAGLRPAFSIQSELRPGILIYPVELQDGVLYIVESEFHEDTDVDIHDAATGAVLQLKLPSQRAALALIDKHTKKIVARYGFE